LRQASQAYALVGGRHLAFEVREAQAYERSGAYRQSAAATERPNQHTMLFLRGLFDRLFIAGAVVAGGLVPGFIAQYRQRLGGRLDQARLDLEPWQRIADQFYQGDLDKLIQYHLNSKDATFHAEGSVIQSLIVTVQRLQSAVDALHSSLFHQLGYLTLHADAGLMRATVTDWVPTFALSIEGVLFALLFAVAVWLVFHFFWWLFALIGSWLLGAVHYAYSDDAANRSRRRTRE
jgi:hypothetical protein